MERKDQSPADEQVKVSMIGHVLIRDKNTQEILLNQRDDFVQQNILGNDNAR